MRDVLPYTEHMARFAFCGILWALKKRRNSNFFSTTFSKFSGTCPVFCIFSPPDGCCLVDGDPIEPVHSINGRRAFFLRLATKGLSCSALLTWIPPRRKRRSKTSSRAAQKKLFFAVHTRTPSVITGSRRLLLRAPKYGITVSDESHFLAELECIRVDEI